MTKSRSTLAVLCLALALAAGPLHAKTATLQESLADLRKAIPPTLPTAAGNLPTPQNQQLTAAVRSLDQVEILASQNRLAEAEQLLAQVRPAVPADNAKGLAAYEAALATLRAKAAEITAKQDAAYATLEQDFVGKFNSKAPAAAYDALLLQIAALTTPGIYNTPNAQKIEQLRNLVTRWQDYLLQSAAGNGQQAYQTINEVMQIAARTPIIPRSQLAAVVTAAAAKANSRADLGDSQPQIDGLRKKLAALIDTAKSPADFDALLAEVPRTNPNYNNNGQAEMMRRAIIRWQDYFAQSKAGNVQAAQNLLREASNDSSLEAYYPRSKVLARLYPQNPNNVPPPVVMASPLFPPAKPNEPLPPLSLDTLDKYALNLPRVLAEAGSGSEDLLMEMNNLRVMKNQLRVGNYQSVLASARFMINSFPNSQGRFGPHAAALMQMRQELVLRALADASKVPAEIRPVSGQSFEDYIRKAVDYARAKKDWDLIARVFINAENTSSLSMGLTQESLAYRNFFAGMQQESAELWPQAVRSYLQCVARGLPSMPVDEIGQRLKRIKADHPAEYTAGSTPNPAVYSTPGPLPVGVRIDPGVPGRP